MQNHYSLFGLVVTDCRTLAQSCPQQKITFASQQHNDWKTLVSVPELEKYDFDFLYDPPPQYTEGKILGHWDTQRHSTNFKNKGNIIGRVYYIRAKVPTFEQNYFNSFLPNFFKDGTDVERKYKLIIYTSLLIGFLVWVIIELLIFNHRQQAKKQAIEAEFKLLEEQQKTLEVENKLLKINGFNNVFEQVIEQQVTSAIANRLQQLDNILKNIMLRIESDANNIIHDIYKAPLLTNNNRKEIIEKFREQQPIIKVSEEFVNLLEQADESVKALEWIVEDLRGITKIASEPILVQEQIKQFSAHLPPSVKEWLLSFEYEIAEPLYINCNPWHLKNIIKNVLYNSSRALKNYRRKVDRSFKGKIWVRCRKQDNLAVIEIEDNGPGIPVELLDKLYESPERLNTERGNLSGNGSMIVYAYLTLHGGKVKKTNTETGAKVSLFFPLILQ